MSRLTKALVVTLSLLSTAGLQAKPIEQLAQGGANTIQRYTFTYDFNNTVHPVVKRIKEQQQFIQYDLVTEVQQSAHNTISEIGYGVFVADLEHIPASDWVYAK